MEFIEVKNLTKKYVSGNIEVTAVDDISFEIKKGEIVVIVGASGAGKTTLLNCISTIDKVTSGHIYVKNEDYGIVKYDLNGLSSISEMLKKLCER